jgi:hypothetical protein
MNGWLLLAQAEVQRDVIGIGGAACVLVWIAIAVAALAIWIWALVDAIQNPGLSNNERLIWVLVIILTNTLGEVIYLIIGRKKRI